MERRLIVIGAGAAGFFCAVNAARLNPELHVTIVEKTKKLLSKVKISGGGRCNVTHACFDMDEMCRQYPRGRYFVRKAFHRFSTKDTIKWFEDRGVSLKTEVDNRMFPVSDSSQSIIDCLLREANKCSVEILLNREVQKIERQASGFNVQFTGHEDMNADFLCVASGGYPKPEMFNWLKELGHKIEEPVPSLFTFNMPGHPITNLMGISVEKAGVKIIGTKLYEEGHLLITHWGMSGPAILRLSAWGAKELSGMNYQFKVLVNWIPEFHDHSLREKFNELRNQHASQKIITRNIFKLPGRLWEFLARESGVTDELRWADLPASNQNRFIKNLCSYECNVQGKTNFKEEFVTAGGIKLSEADPHTMMSKKVLNLFFAGEVLDVDGITGGYNFQHAWTSGWIAANTIANCG